MDSGHSSGSLQSSSGGGDEDSSSISAFLNNNPPPSTPTPTHVGVVAPFNNSSHTHMFDPLSNYLDPTQRSHPSLLNLDMMWSKPIRSEPNRSEPNRTHLAQFLPCSSPPPSSSSQQNQQGFLSTQLPGGDQTRGITCSAFLDTNHTLFPPESGSRGLLSVSAATNNDDQGNNNNNNVVRNPKKRSRASRRAPTTVLTTDTNNFRAMVQEFTGIPAPPFSSSSPFPRTRLDLFPPPLHADTTARPSTTTLLDPPYLLRPFPQKLQQHQHLHPFNSTVSTNSTSNNYPLSSSDDHLGLMKQPPLNFINSMHHNPILTFQNILQQTPNYPLANSSSSVLTSKTKQQPPSLEIPPPSGCDSHLKMGVLEELGLRHAPLYHQNMVSSGNNNLSTSASSMEWAQRTSNDCDHEGGGEGVLRPLSLSGTVTNGKVHYSSAFSSDFHGEKGSEECTTTTTTTTVAAARSECMVESWINCSSD